MNLCILSFQAVLLAVIVVQYNYINEVEAVKHLNVPTSSWFSSLEKKFEIVQEEYRMLNNTGEASYENKEMTEHLHTFHRTACQRFRKRTRHFLAYPRSIVHEVFGTGTDNEDTVNKDYSKSVEISDFLNSQVQRNLLFANVAANVVSDINSEVKSEEELKAPQLVVTEKEAAPKIKRRIKKHKKRIKAKHEQGKHQPHEQRLDASVYQNKADFSGRVIRKNHKKREKKMINQGKFVKTSQKESNSSESGEVNRRKPVDIIVHIKMND